MSTIETINTDCARLRGKGYSLRQSVDGARVMSSTSERTVGNCDEVTGTQTPATGNGGNTTDTNTHTGVAGAVFETAAIDGSVSRSLSRPPCAATSPYQALDVPSSAVLATGTAGSSGTGPSVPGRAVARESGTPLSSPQFGFSMLSVPGSPPFQSAASPPSSSSESRYEAFMSPTPTQGGLAYDALDTLAAGGTDTTTPPSARIPPPAPQSRSPAVALTSTSRGESAVPSTGTNQSGADNGGAASAGANANSRHQSTHAHAQGFDWNTSYVDLEQLSDTKAEEAMRKFRALSRLSQDFVAFVEMYATIIISELPLDYEHKTIKPDRSLGGAAGGDKYVVRYDDGCGAVVLTASH